jgi:small nuclear ribonucleoprotein (snRNP)-like protein
MSKRLIRISSKDIFASLESLLRTEINVVLDNGNTHFGKLESFDMKHLLLRDTRNHPHEIQLAGLYEIVYDAEQP